MAIRSVTSFGGEQDNRLFIMHLGLFEALAYIPEGYPPYSPLSTLSFKDTILHNCRPTALGMVL